LWGVNGLPTLSSGLPPCLGTESPAHQQGWICFATSLHWTFYIISIFGELYKTTTEPCIGSILLDGQATLAIMSKLLFLA
jgi:hypothetical protein